jgi:hypothetical protein
MPPEIVRIGWRQRDQRCHHSQGDQAIQMNERRERRIAHESPDGMKHRRVRATHNRINRCSGSMPGAPRNQRGALPGRHFVAILLPSRVTIVIAQEAM